MDRRGGRPIEFKRHQVCYSVQRMGKPLVAILHLYFDGLPPLCPIGRYLLTRDVTVTVIKSVDVVKILNEPFFIFRS